MLGETTLIKSNPLLVTTTRGPITENRHAGAYAIADNRGVIRASCGDVERGLLPRSSVKMIQALPLMESGAAKDLTTEQLALACASHEGAPIHTTRVAEWLDTMGLTEDALLCGPQPPRDKAMRAARVPASRLLNNCSGKHAGFLTYARHVGAPLDAYIDPAARVQLDVAQAYAEVTGEDAPLAYGIDGCSAPNFIASIAGVARAMALFADPSGQGRARGEAMTALRDAMRAHPLLMSGEGRACAALIEATDGRAVVKTGADGVFAGIVPESGVGFCLKIDDGDRAASEALCAALLVSLGVLDDAHPTTTHLARTPIRNFNGEHVGERRVEPLAM